MLAIVGSPQLNGQNTNNYTSILLKHKGTVDKIDMQQVGHILKTKPASITTTIKDRNGARIEVQLKRHSSEIKASDSSIYFSGKISNKKTSLVTMKISPKGINGLISDGQGNYNYHTGEHLEFKTSTDKKKNSKNWTCGDVSHIVSQSLNTVNNNKSQNTANDTISIVFVCDYTLYVQNGRSTNAVITYVNDIFHQVQALYAQDDILLKIEDIIVWDSADPYDLSSTQNALISFRDHIGTDHQGTLAHLLSASSNLGGGIAFVNGLCDRSRSFGFSHVDGHVNSLGDYSWDVHVVAHELGHNLGSQHTHDCAWGPDGTEAIDGCETPETSCEGAPIPSQGGTIMSYCHNSNVGVNFSLGFGPQPAQRMRETIELCGDSAASSCSTAVTLYENGEYNTGQLTVGAGATDNRATHAKWYKYTCPDDGSISIGSCNQGVDTRLFIYAGDCTGLTLMDDSDDHCFSGSGQNYASEINSLIVTKSQIIYIEWDDRWSSEGFQFTFEFISETESRCNNGIQDGNETGVDCGGECQECMEICNDSNPLQQLLILTQTTEV